jgi:16S rRNA (cytosine967-C5)-methyltransferase
MTTGVVDLPRAVAVQVLQRVIGDRQSLTDVFSGELNRMHLGEQALVKELCFGVLRWHERLRAIVNLLLDRPFKAKDRDLTYLLELGLYQLIYTRIPSHAGVHETVRVATALNKSWAKGLINAVLRNFERQRQDILARVDRSPENRLSHPPWLLERIRQAYPAAWQSICEAANRHPPMTLRVNLNFHSRADYLVELQAVGMNGVAHPTVPSAIVLNRAVDVRRLPGFAAGAVSIQDAAAQLAAPLLDCRPRMRVLDACAAPGGKSAHILESAAGQVDLTMLEIDVKRAARLRAALKRGNWRANLRVADAEDSARWWDGRPFNRILVDAPCSGTGVIRRHPDIKVLRRSADITAMQARQLRLLRALWPLLERGGMLLYATCSLLPEENAQVIDRVVDETGLRVLSQRQILPGEADMDGFYYARLQAPL